MAIKDMTKGNPLKLMIGFAIPMLIGNIFQQIYNLVDTAIVGRFIGANALSAVGTTGSVLFFMTSAVIGLGNGAGIIIGQYFGIKNHKNLRSAVTSLFYIVLALTLFIAVFGTFASGTILRLLRVPEEILSESKRYMQIIFQFSAGMTFYNAAAAILRSVGDSKTPLYTLAIGSVTNIVLDLVFVVGFHMGVEGAAYATVISQILSGILCILHIVRKRDALFLTGIKLRPEKMMIWKIIKTGTPAAFQSSMISLGGMCVQFLINSFGTAAMAAFAASSKIDSIAIQVIVSIGTALSVFTSQNMGAGNFDRIKAALRQTLVIMLAASGAIALFVLIFHRFLLSIFLNPAEAPEAIRIGSTYLSIIGVAYLIAGVMQSYQNVIRGSGDVNTCMVAGFSELGARLVFAYLLVLPFGLTGIWLATPISWGFGCVIPVVRYYSGKWKQKRLV